jgi:small subunit ribosomal protein S2
MAVVTMKQLLEAGVHFGHQTRRWNPKMQRFIFGERNGIYIIDLNQTLDRINTAYTFVRDMVAGGGTILFVGTKKQTQDPIADHARKCGMPFVNERWLGGMLTNFQTISARVKKMQEYERMMEAGDFAAMPKKEALILSRELEKLQRNLGGIRNLGKLPDAVFIIDTKKEHIAVTEANKLGMPIVAVVDTNCDPDLIQYVIPGNDDAIRAGNLMCRIISDAVEEGRHIASRRNAKLQAATAKPSPDAADPALEARRSQQQAEARRQAAVQAQEREARLAAGRRHQPEDESQPTPAGETGSGTADETGSGTADETGSGTAGEADTGSGTDDTAPATPPAPDAAPATSPATEASASAEGGPAVEDSLPAGTGDDDMPAATVDALAAHGAVNAPTMTEIPADSTEIPPGSETPEPAAAPGAAAAADPAAAPTGDGGEA